MIAGVRGILAGDLEPAAALALDEAMVRARPVQPALILWRTAPAVVIGRFQRADWEVDADACAVRGVRVWRRFSGGGAVYLDPGTLCVALVVPAGHAAASLGIPEMYQPLVHGIARALTGLGICAVADERTVRVAGCKVTGIAAHRSGAATLVHGTVLAGADLDALAACLAGPRRGALEGLPEPAASRPDQVANVTAVGLEQSLLDAFGACIDRPSRREQELADELLVTRYRHRSWHSGPWHAVTPQPVRAVLGGA